MSSLIATSSKQIPSPLHTPTRGQSVLVGSWNQAEEEDVVIYLDEGEDTAGGAAQRQTPGKCQFCIYLMVIGRCVLSRNLTPPDSSVCLLVTRYIHPPVHTYITRDIIDCGMNGHLVTLLYSNAFQCCHTKRHTISLLPVHSSGSVRHGHRKSMPDILTHLTARHSLQ